MKYFTLSGEHVSEKDMPIIIEYLGKCVGFDLVIDGKIFMVKGNEFLAKLNLVEEEACSDPRLNRSSRRVVFKLINTRRQSVMINSAYIAPMSLVYKEARL